MSSNPVPLRFGLEIEFLLKPKPAADKILKKYGFRQEITTQSNNSEARRANRYAIRATLAELFGAGGIRTGLSTGDYEQWTPVDEPSLDERPGFWRCEIVSRILDTTSNWQGEVDQVFRILERSYDIRLTPGCSMHVHVSPFNSPKYSVDQIKRILKGVVYYDQPMTRIMPADRKANPWAQSNVEKFPAWRTASLQVPQKRWAPLFDSFDKHKMIAQLLLSIPTDRYVAWNFLNLNATCGTIEFRRPPGVQSSKEAKHWAAVALGFVANATELQDWNAVKLTNTHPSSNSLRSAITRGTERLGQSLQGALRPMPDINAPPTPVAHEELQRIEKKKKDKSKKKSIFAEKVSNSRPNTPVGA